MLDERLIGGRRFSRGASGCTPQTNGRNIHSRKRPVAGRIQLLTLIPATPPSSLLHSGKASLLPLSAGSLTKFSGKSTTTSKSAVLLP
jgi:hypothetical protein